MRYGAAVEGGEARGGTEGGESGAPTGGGEAREEGNMRTGVYLDPVGNGPLPELPQEELGHEPVAGALVEEAHAHHGGGLGGRRDLHLGQGQEGGDVEAEHLGDLGGGKVRPTYVHPRGGGGVKGVSP